MLYKLFCDKKGNINKDIKEMPNYFPTNNLFARYVLITFIMAISVVEFQAQLGYKIGYIFDYKLKGSDEHLLLFEMP